MGPTLTFTMIRNRRQRRLEAAEVNRALAEACADAVAEDAATNEDLAATETCLTVRLHGAGWHQRYRCDRFRHHAVEASGATADVRRSSNPIPNVGNGPKSMMLSCT